MHQDEYVDIVSYVSVEPQVPVVEPQMPQPQPQAKQEVVEMAKEAKLKEEEAHDGQ